MFLRRSKEERRCRFLTFAFKETNDSQFLLKVVMGPDLNLIKMVVEMVVLKRLWPCPEGTDPAGGGFLEIGPSFTQTYIEKYGIINNTNDINSQ